MDLGIKGRRAIVCASSKGLGRACAMALANEGVHVTLTARGAEALKKTADEIRKANPGVTVTEVAGDITTPAGREAVLKACPDPDILINNAGGPPPGDFRNWTRDDWIKAIDANMLTPIELIKATVDGMMARKFGRIVNITSAAVKAPIEILGLSNGARAGLTGFVAGISRKTVINNVTINGLLPGPFDTDRLRGTAKGEAEKRGIDVEQILQGARQAQSRRPVRHARGIRRSPARSCAPTRPASSPGRTSCSTAARSRARCEGGLVRTNGASARGADPWRDADACGRPGRSPGAAGGVRRQSRRCRPPRRRLSRDGISARDPQQRRRRDHRPDRRRRHAAQARPARLAVQRPAQRPRLRHRG